MSCQMQIHLSISMSFDIRKLDIGNSFSFMKDPIKLHGITTGNVQPYEVQHYQVLLDVLLYELSGFSWCPWEPAGCKT